MHSLVKSECHLPPLPGALSSLSRACTLPVPCPLYLHTLTPGFLQRPSLLVSPWHGPGSYLLLSKYWPIGWLPFLHNWDCIHLVLQFDFGSLNGGFPVLGTWVELFILYCPESDVQCASSMNMRTVLNLIIYISKGSECQCCEQFYSSTVV